MELPPAPEGGDRLSWPEPEGLRPEEAPATASGRFPREDPEGRHSWPEDGTPQHAGNEPLLQPPGRLRPH